MKEEFKVGDTVKRTGSDNTDVIKGEIYEITRIEQYGWIYLKDIKDSYYKNNFELVKRNSIQQFKIGQRVTLVDSWKEELNGEKGTITRGTYAGNMVSVLLDCRDESTSCYARRLELIETQDKYELKRETNEVNTMEIKDIKIKNLKEAKAQFEKEQANAEIEYAKKELRTATDKVDELDRYIKQYQEDKKPHLETIAKFK